MENIERLIFEHSMLLLEIHDFLGKVDYSKKFVSANVVKRAKQHFETILHSENGEIVLNAKNKTNVYNCYNKFYSEYLDNPVAPLGAISQNRTELYNSVLGTIITATSQLTELVNGYTGTDENVITLAENAIMCVKGRVCNSMLAIMKNSLNNKTDFYTQIPKEFGDAVDQTYAMLECSKVKYVTDRTCVNTIYTMESLKDILELFNNALLTKQEVKDINNRESYSIYTPHNSWVHTDKFGFKYTNKLLSTGFGERLKEKQKITTQTLPNKIKEQKDQIFETLKNSYVESTYFAEKLYEKFNYPQYYKKIDINVEKVAEQSTSDNKNAEKVNVSKQTTKKAKVKREIDFGKLFGELWYGISLPFKLLGKLFAKIGVGIWKGFCWLSKIIAYPFVLLFKLIAHNPVVGIVLGLVVVVTPITLYFVFKKPCCYDYGKVVAESTCTTHGKAEYKCWVHNKTKTVELPLKHNVSNNVCVGCGESFETSVSFYTHENVLYVDAKFVNGKYEWYDDVVVCPTQEDGEVNSVNLDGVKAKNVELYLPNTATKFSAPRGEFKNLTIYVGNNGTVVDLQECEVKNLNIVGNVKEIANANSVKKIVSYGHVTTLIVEDYSKLDRFVATSGVSAINTNNFGKTMFLSSEMAITYSIEENEDLQNIYVDENHISLKSVDGVVYTKDLSKLVCYPKNKREKTLVLPAELKTDENLVIQLKNVSRLRTIKYPDGLDCVHLNFDESTKIKNVKIGTGVKELYVALVGDLEKVTFAESDLTFEGYRRKNGSFTEKLSDNFVTKSAEENAEYLKSLGFTCKFNKI